MGSLEIGNHPPDIASQRLDVLAQQGKRQFWQVGGFENKGTHNPSVAGSSPARPTIYEVQ
jgi:hypothetical protein